MKSALTLMVIDYMDQLCKKVGEIVNDENDMAFPAFYGVDDLKRLPADLSLSQVRTLEKWGASIQAVFEQHVLNRADCPDDNVCIQPVDNGKNLSFSYNSSLKIKHRRSST